MKLIQLFLFLSLVAAFTACQRPEDNSCATDFDQLKLLENIGSTIILPNYATLAEANEQLESAIVNFSTTPSLGTLDTARTQFKKAWLAWQAAALFEFGPAETEDLRNFCNNFPANITRIQENISAGTYDLNAEPSSYARGFPALDYLLYGENKSNTEIVDWYTTDTQAANRQQYIKALATLLKQKTTAVHNAWKADGGNYINTFTTTEGVSNGKPLSDLVNQWNKNAELIKNNRLGTPISAKTSYTPLRPENVEAYYSKFSLELVEKAVKTQQAVFVGGNGVGLEDYVEATEAKKGDKSLAVLINEHYTTLLTALNALQGSTLHDAITTNLDGVKAAYAAAQNQAVLTKTDLPAALCVNITYIDNVDDGD